MLWGAARKLALPFILLSLVGWITFGVGFGIRNFEYEDRSDDFAGDNELDNAGKPEFFFHWLYGLVTPALIGLTFFHAFCGNRITAFMVFLFVPFFLMGAGAILYFNGLQIYSHYEIADNDNVPGGDGTIHVLLVDVYQLVRVFAGENEDTWDINGDDKFAPIEFAGAMASVIFYWVVLLLMPFFATKEENYAPY